MKNAGYNFQVIVNLLISILYIFGGLTFIFPNEPPIIQSCDTIAIGIALLTTGIFGSPYLTLFEIDDTES